jgi:hypothetical protein
MRSSTSTSVSVTMLPRPFTDTACVPPKRDSASAPPSRAQRHATSIAVAPEVAVGSVGGMVIGSG